MNSRFIPAAVAAAVSFAVPLAADAAQRTFVHSSPLGNDANTVSNCSLAAPCRSFNAAISVTDPGGELVILDTAGYGPMTINKAIKVIGPSGVYGGISVLGGGGATAGVVINAGSNDVITLRGLDISGVPGGAPLPLIGIDIQNAGIVHIEKSSISNFTQPTSACINAAPSAPVTVYVDDSFLRECRTGFNVNGTALPAAGDPAVLLAGNTRIEHGRATSGPSYGVWVQGYAAVLMRNSQILANDTGIQMDNLAANGVSNLVLAQSQVIGGNSGLNVVNASAGAHPEVTIVGSEFYGFDDGIVYSNAGPGAPVGGSLKITDSHFENMSNSGITASAGADAKLSIELVRSQVTRTGNTAIGVAASGTSAVGLHVRESTLSDAAQALLKTSGTSQVLVSLIRSNLHNSFTAVDHGRGRIRMEQTNVNTNTNSLVNNGSGDIVSTGTNWIVDNADGTPGKTYITPLISPPMK